jgi:membrane protein YqaA with SNARE-associated domain
MTDCRPTPWYRPRRSHWVTLPLLICSPLVVVLQQDAATFCLAALLAVSLVLRSVIALGTLLGALVGYILPATTTYTVHAEAASGRAIVIGAILGAVLGWTIDSYRPKRGSGGWVARP